LLSGDRYCTCAIGCLAATTASGSCLYIVDCLRCGDSTIDGSWAPSDTAGNRGRATSHFGFSWSLSGCYRLRNGIASEFVINRQRTAARCCLTAAITGICRCSNAVVSTCFRATPISGCATPNYVCARICNSSCAASHCRWGYRSASYYRSR